MDVRLTECQESGQGIAFVWTGKMGIVCGCCVAAMALPSQQQSFYRHHSLFNEHVKYAFALFIPLEQARFKLATWAIRQSTGRQALIHQIHH